jgi:hypothetical protein
MLAAFCITSFYQHAFASHTRYTNDIFEKLIKATDQIFVGNIARIDSTCWKEEGGDVVVFHDEIYITFKVTKTMKGDSTKDEIELTTKRENFEFHEWYFGVKFSTSPDSYLVFIGIDLYGRQAINYICKVADEGVPEYKIRLSELEAYINYGKKLYKGQSNGNK